MRRDREKSPGQCDRCWLIKHAMCQLWVKKKNNPKNKKKKSQPVGKLEFLMCKFLLIKAAAELGEPRRGAKPK